MQKEHNADTECERDLPAAPPLPCSLVTQVTKTWVTLVCALAVKYWQRESPDSHLLATFLLRDTDLLPAEEKKTLVVCPSSNIFRFDDCFQIMTSGFHKMLASLLENLCTF